MKRFFLSFVLINALFMANTSFVGHADTLSSQNLNNKKVQLKYDMQKRWLEHAWWTRDLIVSGLAGIPDQDMVIQRFLENGEDIGNLLKPYYGEEAGNKFTALLKEHILLAVKIISAAKKGDQQSVARLDHVWHQNADKIVGFLAGINANWQRKDLTVMFYEHLKLASDDVDARLKKDWARDINVTDKNEAHLMKMADMLTAGIVKQFPEKFE